MLKGSKKYIIGLAAALALNITAGAETLKRFYFTGETSTERVVVTIDDKKETIIRMTPSRDYNYIITDYDYSFDENYGNETLRCKVADALYGKEYDVLLTYNSGRYADIRIGLSRLTFSHVSEYYLEK